ncbi:MAG: DNA gyrase inhibitor YacG [Planctomycetia bacterium]|nr:DNA gyrase inhibitor YacG [Planctomycetia bacterium]
MAQRKCPTCGRSFESTTSPSMPFCSPRCRQIDTARWLGEQYTIPGRPLDDEELAEHLPPQPDEEE